MDAAIKKNMLEALAEDEATEETSDDGDCEVDAGTDASCVSLAMRAHALRRTFSVSCAFSVSTPNWKPGNSIGTGCRHACLNAQD